MENTVWGLGSLHGEAAGHQHPPRGGAGCVRVREVNVTHAAHAAPTFLQIGCAAGWLGADLLLPHHLADQNTDLMASAEAQAWW